MPTHPANYQPKGMNTVVPYMMVNQVGRLIHFIESVFSGKLKYKLDRPDGSVMHAEVAVGDSVIMMGEPMPEYGEMPASIYVYVPDCDETYRKAIQNGAESVMVPADMRHAGERYGGVRDFSGNIWWIATHKEDLTPEEQARRVQEMDGGRQADV